MRSLNKEKVISTKLMNVSSSEQTYLKVFRHHRTKIYLNYQEPILTYFCVSHFCYVDAIGRLTTAIGKFGVFERV